MIAEQRKYYSESQEWKDTGTWDAHQSDGVWDIRSPVGKWVMISGPNIWQNIEVDDNDKTVLNLIFIIIKIFSMLPLVKISNNKIVLIICIFLLQFLISFLRRQE